LEFGDRGFDDGCAVDRGFDAAGGKIGSPVELPAFPDFGQIGTGGKIGAVSTLDAVDLEQAEGMKQGGFRARWRRSCLQIGSQIEVDRSFSCSGNIDRVLGGGGVSR
jgi:hypothetical protein